jgi:hypothetical protein
MSSISLTIEDRFILSSSITRENREIALKPLYSLRFISS